MNQKENTTRFNPYKDILSMSGFGTSSADKDNTELETLYKKEQKMYRILKHFHGSVVPNETLIWYGWGSKDYSLVHSSLRKQISSLRQKMRECQSNEDVYCLSGRGYVLAERKNEDESLLVNRVDIRDGILVGELSSLLSVLGSGTVRASRNSDTLIWKGDLKPLAEIYLLSLVANYPCRITDEKAHLELYGRPVLFEQDYALIRHYRYSVGKALANSDYKIDNEQFAVHKDAGQIGSLLVKRQAQSIG